MLKSYKRDINNKTLIMGILNCTPDSFSDGGRYDSIYRQMNKARELRTEGADIIDIGGESTRPGYTPISAEQELARILPIVRILAEQNIYVSVDTTKPEVAAKCAEAGCSLINDIGGDLKNSGMADIAAANGTGLVIMFNARNGESDEDILVRAKKELSANIEFALSKGIPEEKIIVDPGVGFGTTREEDIALIKNIDMFSFDGKFATLCGVSRKRIIRQLYDWGDDLDLADDASDSVAMYSVSRGCSVIRTHRAGRLRLKLDIYDALLSE